MLITIVTSVIRAEGGASYLHYGIERGVGANAEVRAGHIITDGGGQHAHGHAELLIPAAGIDQLQQTLKGLQQCTCIRTTAHLLSSVH